MPLPSWITRTTTHIATLIGLTAIAATTAHAQIPPQEFLTGQELLTTPTVRFPDGVPTSAGSSIILGPATTARKVLIETTYPPGGTFIDLGLPALFVTWELTRLSCIESINCNGAGGPSGAVDHDPVFFIAQGNKAYAWEIADNLRGSYYTSAFELNNDIAGLRVGASTRLENSNFFPAINQSYTIAISYILQENSVRSTMNVVLPGRPDIRSFPFTFTQWGGFDPTQSVRVGIISDDNIGERYQLNRAGIAPISEPSMMITSLLGIIVVGLVHRRRKRPQQKS